MLQKLFEVLTHEYMDFVYLAAFVALLGWVVYRQKKSGVRQAFIVEESIIPIQPVMLMDSPGEGSNKSQLDDVRINPSTGLPIYGGASFDIGGNVYGSSNDDLHR